MLNVKPHLWGALYCNGLRFVGGFVYCHGLIFVYTFMGSYLWGALYCHRLIFVEGHVHRGIISSSHVGGFGIPLSHAQLVQIELGVTFMGGALVPLY